MEKETIANIINYNIFIKWKGAAGSMTYSEFETTLLETEERECSYTKQFYYFLQFYD